MFVNTEQVQIGISNYIEDEIAKKAVGFQKFAVYFMLPKINELIPVYIKKFSAIDLGLVDADGNIDIDSIYNMAKNAVKKSGQFTFLGIIFNETDIDKMYTYIKNTQTR